MSDIEPAQQMDLWDPSQFRLQSDGTFRISIRGMASMAGIDFGGLARSLKSAVDETPLPCARSLVAQGFDPVDVMSWSETSGIPEDAAPYILEHYGINAASPSQQARAVFLAFVRVGINAYLKERLGIAPERGNQPPVAPQRDVLGDVQRSVNLLELLGGVDDRARLILRDVVLNYTATNAGGSIPTLSAAETFMTISEYLQYDLQCPGHSATKYATKYGKAVKDLYRNQNNRDPKSAMHLVNGRNCNVATYEKSWLISVDFKKALDLED